MLNQGIMNNYKTNVKIMDKQSKLFYCFNLVKATQVNSISEVARSFGTTRVTVRKWLKRYNESGLDGLSNLSRLNQEFPNRMPDRHLKKILALRRQYMFWGARRIKDYLNLIYSDTTINKKIKQAGLIKKKKRRYKRRKELSMIRKSFKAFEKFQVDVKYLTDIPEIAMDLKFNKLPKYQITARDYKTGMQFIGFSYEKTSTSTGIYIDYLCQKLKEKKVDLKLTTFQTDNGSEFVSNSKKRISFFDQIVLNKYSARRKLIPPARPTYNSDVESVHATIEDEFYKVERFDNKADMINKAWAYTLYYNNFRKNRGRENKTPKDILIDEKCRINHNVLNIKPIITDYFYKNIINIKMGGYFYCLPPICRKSVY